MPYAGTPFLDIRLNCCGNRPSSAAASGISAQIIVQPFSAPNPEMDHCDGHHIPRRSAAEHRVDGVGERGGRRQRS